MITLIRKLAHALLWDDLAVRRWIRGSLLWGSTLAAQAMADPEWGNWTWRQWIGRLAVAAVGGAAGMVTAGERNPRP